MARAKTTEGSTTVAPIQERGNGGIAIRVEESYCGYNLGFRPSLRGLPLEFPRSNFRDWVQGGGMSAALTGMAPHIPLARQNAIRIGNATVRDCGTG